MSFNLCLSCFSANKVDQVITFKQMNVTSPTTSKTQTITNGLINAFSIRISYPHHIFIAALAQ